MPLVFADIESMSRYAADTIVEQIRAKPDSLLCAASGSTPTRTYEILVEHFLAEPGLFDQLRVIKLDEWGGLSGDDLDSCDHHLRTTLIDPIGLEDRYVAFDGRAASPERECERIQFWLAEHGPIDICVLGLGVNGHLGFNEPGDALWPHAHAVRLSESSQGHAMVRDRSDKPDYGITLGMADLLRSRHIFLLVSGMSKREPMERLLSGAVSTHFPASFLHLHPHVALLCDAEAYPAELE
jgi:galactosamine-6-phosphate isomerase